MRFLLKSCVVDAVAPEASWVRPLRAGWFMVKNQGLPWCPCHAGGRATDQAWFDYEQLERLQIDGFFDLQRSVSGTME
ncbi:hypothetical protein [Alcaligenes sp. WGS1538]|uniref:hypothetical protein n=1 Tax=Alcaligenes sp. WGS1538 TaxID=3366811 RepID=UPI00372D42C2